MQVTKSTKQSLSPNSRLAEIREWHARASAPEAEKSARAAITRAEDR
jgi:hypothetical protein